MTRDMQIYVAGPLGDGVSLECVARALKVGDMVADVDERFRPFVPHLFAFWHLHKPHSRKWYMDIDLAYVRASHALIRLPGESAGSDEEVSEAQFADIPVLALSSVRKHWQPQVEVFLEGLLERVE